MDRLYIKDIWGYKGSYYLMDRGTHKPIDVTKSIIDKILREHHYKKIYTAGTSKGGYCAIYYGLIYRACQIFSGACQFHIGDYLNTDAHINILHGMLGYEISDEKIKMLNKILPSLISENKGSKVSIHLVYSKKDHTYQDHIIDLINYLKQNQIYVEEEECYFEHHNDVGLSFIPYVNNFFKHEGNV